MHLCCSCYLCCAHVCKRTHAHKVIVLSKGDAWLELSMRAEEVNEILCQGGVDFRRRAGRTGEVKGEGRSRKTCCSLLRRHEKEHQLLARLLPDRLQQGVCSCDCKLARGKGEGGTDQKN